MIAEAELRRQAARWQVDPMVIDLDYTLSWFLAGFFSSGEAAKKLRFKGGTCLRKCYFPDHRFSEDLDFTATTFLTIDMLKRWVEEATEWAAEHDGPNFAANPMRLEIIEDEYGSEAFEVRVYFRGPLHWGGSPRAIRLDVTRYESLLLPAASYRLIHPYSDVEMLKDVEIPSYAAEEILAEKLRAAGGQRRFAVSRDLYDIHRLIQTGVSVTDVVPLLPDKFAAREVPITKLDVDYLLSRRTEFEVDWERRLSYLVSVSEHVTFEIAWQSTVEAIRLAQSILRP